MIVLLVRVNRYKIKKILKRKSLCCYLKMEKFLKINFVIVVKLSFGIEENLGLKEMRWKG